MTTERHLWYLWDRPQLGWRLQEARFGDGLRFDELPVDRTVRVLNRNAEESVLDGHRLPPDRWVDIPTRALARRSTEHNVRVDLEPVRDALPTRTADERPVIDWWGPIDAVRGYGRQSLDMWRGLRELGVDARLHPSQHQHAAAYQADCAYVDDSVLQAMSESASPARVAVAMATPFDPVLVENPSPVKIAITQHDTDSVPASFVDRVNQCDHLVVTASFQYDIWKLAGVRVPMSVLVSGIDTDVFTEVPHPPGETFRVLILGALTPRKNVPAAVRIFQRASDGDPTWRLTIKNRGKLHREIKVAARADSRITVERTDGDPSQVLESYHSHDCFVWPSKGEGVGLPPMEAMACGMEVVGAHHSGMLDYLGEDRAWPVRTASTVPADGHGEEFAADFVAAYGPAGNYWLLDEEHGAQQLRAAHRAWQRGEGKGHRAAEYIRANHSVLDQARSILSVVEQYV